MQVSTLTRVLALHKHFHSGAIPTLAEHEVHPDLPLNSRENYLYFTLPPCINFQRNSPAMWQAALKTWNDPETNYVFFPEKLAHRQREEVQRDLLKHKLALQPNKHTDIWSTISRAFHNLYEDDPRALLECCDWDVVKIHSLIQSERRKDFPYISGPKLAHYWLYILTHYTNAKFKHMEEISIIPDTHVLQATVALGITEKLESPLVVVDLWRTLLAGSDVTPVEMHPVLWNWSRNGFKPEV